LTYYERVGCQQTQTLTWFDDPAPSAAAVTTAWAWTTHGTTAETYSLRRSPAPWAPPFFTPSLVSQSQFPLFFLLNLTYLFLDEQQQPRVCIYEQNDTKLEAWGELAPLWW
jgi:hypothetical protein